MNNRTFTPTAAQIDAARIVFTVMALGQLVKPQVEAYQREILARHQWPADAEWAGYKNVPAVILEPKDAFVLSKEHHAIYCEEMKAARDAAGLKVERPDNCPALECDSKLIEAQNLLIDAMEPVGGITWDKLMCSARALENKDKYVSLCLRLLAPHVGTGTETLNAVMA